MTKFLLITLLTIFISYRNVVGFYKSKQFKDLFSFALLVSWLFIVLWNQEDFIRLDFMYRIKYFVPLSYSKRDRTCEKDEVYDTAKILLTYTTTSSTILIVFPQEFLKESDDTYLGYRWFKLNYRLYPRRIDYVIQPFDNSCQVIDCNYIKGQNNHIPFGECLKTHQYIAYYSLHPSIPQTPFSNITTIPSCNLYLSKEFQK